MEKKSRDEEFSAAARSFVRLLGQNQTDQAAKMGLTQANLSRKLNGWRPWLPTERFLMMLARASYDELSAKLPAKQRDVIWRGIVERAKIMADDPTAFDLESGNEDE